MQGLDQAEYYRRRETDQRIFASRATCPDAAAFHASLADRYAALTSEAVRFGTRLYSPR